MAFTLVEMQRQGKDKGEEYRELLSDYDASFQFI